MSRWVLALLVLVAAGGALGLLLFQRSEVAPGRDLERETRVGEDDPTTPRLVGVGEEATPPAVHGEGRFRTTGIVVDAAGTPVDPGSPPLPAAREPPRPPKTRRHHGPPGGRSRG